MKLEIEVNEDAIKDIIVRELAHDICKNGWAYDARCIKRIFAETAKELLYEPKVKKKLISDAVNKAAAEIARKGLPKLVEKMAKEKA